MTAMTDILASPQFSTLPAELRTQIWRECLPEEIESAVFTYKKGCWQPRYILESDEDYDAENFYGIHVNYRHELLDSTEIKLPLFFVNREARGIAQAWIRTQGIRIRFRQGATQPVFVRHFIPLQDTLYVPPERYDEFCCEPYDRVFEPDLVGQTLSHGGREVPNVAIPEHLFWLIGTPFEEVFLQWYCPAVLLVVMNAHADTGPYDKCGKLLEWRLKNTRTRSLIWSLEHRRFTWGEGESVCDQDMYDRIEEMANRDLVGWLVSDSYPSFEIRPVLVVRI